MRAPPIPEGNEVSGAIAATMPPVDETGSAETEGQVCEHFQRAAEILGRRWNPQVIRVLLYGPARFGELRERVPGISDNLLSERLKQLEAEGIVAQDRPRRPARPDRVLADRGRGRASARRSTRSASGPSVRRRRGARLTPLSRARRPAGARAPGRSAARTRTARTGRGRPCVWSSQRRSRCGPSSTRARTSSTPRPCPRWSCEHVDVGEVRDPAVAHDAREPDLPSLVVQADRARGRAHLPLDRLARTVRPPVRLGRQEGPDRVEVQARRIVVELVAVGELALHGSERRSRPASSSRSVTSAA